MTNRSEHISLAYVSRWLSGGRPSGRNVSRLKRRHRSLVVDTKEDYKQN